VTKKAPTFFEKALFWIGNHNWQIVGGITLGITLFEIIEIIIKQDSLADPFHIVELLIYIVILVLVGVLIHYLNQANARQTHIMQILEYKHNISLKLTEQENWETLTGELLKIPNSIIAIKGSRLFVQNPVSGGFEIMTEWHESGTVPPDFDHDCLTCMQKRSDSNFKFSSCNANAISLNNLDQPQEFCLPLIYVNSLFAIIQFKLKDGERLSQDQIEIFDNIGPEITLALRASLERKILTEMRAAEAALAERHSVSTYLHDHLSQNLAYICLKLEQLSKEEEFFLSEYKKTDLPHMMDAANQSYEILRDLLETMHPETTPRLVNLIKEHARKESKRAHFEIAIETTGQEFSVSPEVQKAVFYVFLEVLNNIEKHAKAKSVKVLMHWKEECLNMSIADDGIGFDPQNLDGSKHFGLDIMQERVYKVGGQIDVQSATGSGTEINISVPVLSLKKKGN